MPHPVKLMGNIISIEDNYIRRRIEDEKKLRIAGLIVAIFNIIISFFLPYILLNILSSKVSRITSIYIMYSCLAAKSLDYEAKKVLEKLDISLEEGRERLAYIVGRDTSCLEEEGVISATIETVAENTSDGVIAPLFYMFLLGPAGGLMYKMVNTMDSMLGYKNEKYIDFGRYPAIIDDIFNYIPARITAILMLLSSYFSYNYRRGYEFLKKYKNNHSSPNAGYPESAVAGLLGIRLGGPNIYHGKLVEKPYIGEDINKLNKSHIIDTLNIMYRTEILFVIIYICCIVVKTLI